MADSSENTPANSILPATVKTSMFPTNERMWLYIVLQESKGNVITMPDWELMSTIAKGKVTAATLKSSFAQLRTQAKAHVDAIAADGMQMSEGGGAKKRGGRKPGEYRPVVHRECQRVTIRSGPKKAISADADPAANEGAEKPLKKGRKRAAADEEAEDHGDGEKPAKKGKKGKTGDADDEDSGGEKPVNNSTESKDSLEANGEANGGEEKTPKPKKASKADGAGKGEGGKKPVQKAAKKAPKIVEVKREEDGEDAIHGVDTVAAMRKALKAQTPAKMLLGPEVDKVDEQQEDNESDAAERAD